MFLAFIMDVLFLTMSYFDLGFVTEHVAEAAALADRGYNYANPSLGNPLTTQGMQSICEDLQSLTAIPLLNMSDTSFTVEDQANTGGGYTCSDGARIIASSASSQPLMIVVKSSSYHSFYFFRMIGPVSMASEYSVNKGAYNYVAPPSF